MDAEPIDYDFEAECRRWHKARVKGRSDGVHLSTIIHYIVEKMDPQRFSGGAIEHTAVHGGFVWEDTLDVVFGRQFGNGKQFELFEDGIYMTPDYMDFKAWRIREFKFTKMSAAHPIRSSKFWHWHIQIACYCRAMDTLEAELVVLHVNGSYELAGGKFGKTVAKPWLLRFTKRELDEYWWMVLRARDRMVKEGL